MQEPALLACRLFLRAPEIEVDMATTLTLATTVSFAGTYSTDADLETAVASIVQPYYTSYSNGTGNSQVNTWWADTLAITTGTTSYDLTSGMTDRWGNSLTFTKIKEIFIYNRDTTDANYVTVAGSFLASLAVMTAMGVFGGETVHYRRPLTGFAIVNGVNDALTFTGSTSLSMDLILVGTR